MDIPFGWFLLYLLGFGLLFAEIFIPSGGALGLAAIGCTGFAIYRIFQEGGTTMGVFSILFFLAYIVAMITWWLKRVTSTARLEKAESLGTDWTIDRLKGMVGETMSILRPTGMARFGDRKVTVVTMGNFVPRGAKVQVVETSGNRVVVREVAEPGDSGSPGSG